MRPIHIHIHQGTQEATPSLKTLMDDLVDRMWAALEEVKASTPTKDEAPGHAFHGNQWTKVAVKPQAEDLKEKTSKGKLRELLESGHPFSKDELMKIAGIEKEATFTTWMGFMKNPKYAGKKGALQIIKTKEGLFQVTGYLEEAPEASNATTAALSKAMSPMPKAEPAAPPPAAEKKEEVGHLSALLNAAPGSLSATAASKYYDAFMAEQGKELVANLEGMATSPGAKKDAVIDYKKAKAAGMAAWAKAVKGTPYSPKDLGYFKADEQLGTDLTSNPPVPLAKALADWKHNTMLEKSGAFGATPKATKAAGATAPSMTTTHTMGDPIPVAPVPYEALRPAGFKDIADKDFTGAKGFSTGIAKARADFLARSAENAQKNKASIEHRLRDRLKDKPNFQALVTRLGLIKEGSGSLESRLIQTWAGSSGDGNDLSVSMQLAVRDAFGIPDGHVEKKQLHSLKDKSEAQVYAKGFQQLNANLKPPTEKELPVIKEALKEFVQAQYAETQAMLKEMGHDHLYLARGMKLKAENEGSKAQLKLQPASSFSTNYTTAKAFAGASSGTVFLTKVPREQVLSTYLTGFGCTSEHEVVVLAHHEMKAYAVPANAAGGHLQAKQYVASKKGVAA